MKNLFYLLTISFALTIGACNDPCDDLDCGTNGTCDEGLCICDSGYEGTNCEALVIDKYLGTWTSTDFQCDGDAFGEDIVFVFQQGATINDLEFYDTEEPDVIFQIDYDGNDLTMPATTIEDGVVVSGTGTLHSEISMSWIFLIEEDGGIVNCSGTFTK